MTLIAHRGFACCFPENTLEAIDGAIGWGALAVEVDVRFSRDTVPVLMHDATVDRTTNGSGHVRDLSADDIGLLNACTLVSTSCGVPRLDQAVRHAMGRAKLVLDLKEVPSAAQFQRLVHAIGADTANSIAIISGDMRTLRLARNFLADLPLGYYPNLDFRPPADTASALAETVAIGNAELLLKMQDVVNSSSIFLGALERGLSVTPWTAHSSSELRTLLSTAGVRRVLTEVP